MEFSVFRAGRLCAAVIAALGFAASCVSINDELGKEFIPTNHQYDVYVAEFPLKDIKMKQTDSLSGYSSDRFVIGSILDETFGSTTRGTAFTLIPILEDGQTSLDFGENPVVTQFHFTAAKDTVSYRHSNQEKIIQNINVYALTEEIGEKAIYLSSEKELKIDRSKRITNGIPLYTGGDSLSFDFSTEFANLYVEKLKDMVIDTIPNYVKELPGIYITVDERSSQGGRINLFGLALDVQDSYYITGNYAELKFRSKYGTREQVDTSFLFYFGAQDFDPYQETSISSYYTSTSATPQYALNITTHQTSILPESATDKIYIEGGGGVKPVFSAKEIRDSCIALFERQGFNPQEVIINKALLTLPFQFPMTDEGIDRFPDRLSPTCQFRGTDDEGNKYVSYAGLTDSSVSTEDPGNINRSLCRYTPDIGHHVQEVIRRTDEDDDIEQYDIWLLIMKEEVVESSSSSDSMNDYYSNLMYYSYLNSLYNGYGYGYGSYGYGSSYYGYSNYINYALAAQYASSSSSSTETSYQLDRDRYYHGELNGPNATAGDVPVIRLTYSVARE